MVLSLFSHAELALVCHEQDVSHEFARTSHDTHTHKHTHTHAQDVSHDFAHTNGFEVLARAHQMVMRGYNWSHDERVLTVSPKP